MLPCIKMFFIYEVAYLSPAIYSGRSIAKYVFSKHIILICVRSTIANWSQLANVLYASSHIICAWKGHNVYGLSAIYTR